MQRPQRQQRLPLADVPSEDPPSTIRPPVPAPYLADAAIQLPDDLLLQMDGHRFEPNELARMRRYIRVCKRRVKHRRQRYEKTIGRVIQPEEPWRP
ncbi:MAG: hypothetical protein L0211_02240 [Planctomycetaceae bacterium]|nr:hypothetical protein [Planctomycetaceae bacterium]